MFLMRVKLGKRIKKWRSRNSIEICALAFFNVNVNETGQES